MALAGRSLLILIGTVHSSLSNNKIIYFVLYTFFSANTIPKLKKGRVFLKKFKKSLPKAIYGGLIGVINGFFGAGGGLVCIPLLMKIGMERKVAHANAVAIIFPITLVSAINYLVQGRVQITDAIMYIPGGLLGALAGTLIMKKLSPKFIRKIFGGFMIWAGWRLVLR